MLPKLDDLIVAFDRGLRTVFAPAQSLRPVPGDELAEAELSAESRAHAAALMRVNHVGEVCAQALYQGQALTARLPNVRDRMEQAATEENDHLAWTKRRASELGTHTSCLNPIFYAGSFAIGALAGAAGDQWSLGFVAETERQVVRHLNEHLGKLPPQDDKSRAILEQMREDEGHHATTAINAGAAELPPPIKQAMRFMSKVMTRSVYWV